ncbi:D111/G-patch domain-containing protein [Rhynchospora pubera]|uniref:D111/G-patch domain-containing protein n=1 Tax=Rhynchospora pubera TaxID=906938 RepID=A0AAV8FTL0_9POAL|nr:D111/G-patch domain-containing protein [Rhynchospora pubera]
MAAAEQEAEAEAAPGLSSSSEFVWDSQSGLYFHPSTGFYHDPIAGWYYSSRDRFYYAFQDGAYVPLSSHSQKDEVPQQNQPQAYNCLDKIAGFKQGSSSCDESKPQHDSRPSDWLDEVLINEYLSGYHKAESNTAHHFTGPHSQTQTDVGEEGQIDDKPSELRDAILDKQENNTVQQYGFGTEGILSAEEESWMSQYGQVDRSDAEEDIVKAVDLWDWEFVEERDSKGHNRRRARLTGRLMGPSSSLHPSLAAGGGNLKTTVIHQVHLDHVLVASGKVYRLRTPSKRYLATLSEYDSSNPTKDWGFPVLSLQSISLLSPRQPPTSDLGTDDLYPSIQKKEEKGGDSHRYRDRAAERRRLHGANGIAPCQKGDDRDMGCASDDDPTIAQEEARLLSFGTQSYAGKIMQSMGWKQGEALGGSRKGILEPLQAIGNIGTAGLGWKHN